MDIEKIIEDFRYVSRAEWLLDHKEFESGTKNPREIDDVDIFIYCFVQPMESVKRIIHKGVNPNKVSSFNYAMEQMKTNKEAREFWENSIEKVTDELTLKFLLVWFVLNVGRAGTGKINKNLTDTIRINNNIEILENSRKLFLANRKSPIGLKYTKVNVNNSHTREINRLNKFLEE